MTSAGSVEAARPDHHRAGGGSSPTPALPRASGVDGGGRGGEFAAPATNALPDLSSMSPQEAAERLFNRIMTAAEQGDSGEAQRFVPMALQAYGQLGVLDNDGHYHVGLLHVTISDTDSAQAELDLIRQSVPNHLLGLQLEHAIAQALSDEDRVKEVNRRFLDAYDAEIATGRSEYQGHRRGIDGFRDRAAAAIP